MEENLIKSEEKKEKEEDKKTDEVKEKNPKQQKDNKKGKSKAIIICSIIGILIVLGIIISTVFALFNINNEKIINGVSVAGIDLSGLSKEEAKTKIEDLYNEKMQKEINLKYQEYEETLNPALLEVNYNTDKAIEEAYLIGRNNNIIVNNYEILFTLLGKKDVNMEMSLDEEKAKAKIEEIGLNLPGVVVESSYSIEEDELIITKGKPGIKVDTEKFLEKIKFPQIIFLMVKP